MNTHAQTGTELFLSVAQAAEQLSVHPSSIRRWIDQGRLPAQRIGYRRIGVRPADLAKMVSPRGASDGQASSITRDDLQVTPRLTDQQQRRGRAAQAELLRLREQVAARLGKLAPESWELTNRSRDHRTGELGRAVEA
jgi:excisionase family DNA binding protein